MPSLRSAKCRLQSLFSRSNVCVVILTKSSDTNLQLRRACEAYKNNRSIVSICVVESGDFELDIDIEYYLRPEASFHYNKFVQFALSKIDIDKFDAVIISNDDVIPLKGAVDQMVMSGFDSCSPIDPSAYRWNNVSRPTIGYYIEYHLTGWCICMSHRLLKMVPTHCLFNDRYHFNGQDIYYSKLLESLGIPHAVVPDAKVVHLEHQSHSLVDSKFLIADSVLEHIDSDVLMDVEYIKNMTR